MLLGLNLSGLFGVVAVLLFIISLYWAVRLLLGVDDRPGDGCALPLRLVLEGELGAVRIPLLEDGGGGIESVVMVVLMSVVPKGL